MAFYFDAFTSNLLDLVTNSSWRNNEFKFSVFYVYIYVSSQNSKTNNQVGVLSEFVRPNTL